MGKTTIILADTDEKFLAPLEIKFLEELDDNAELEVITDPAFFEEYFSSPKSASVLLVSEELYTSALQRHTINNIFVLSENTEEGRTEDLIITKIFKYTSPKDIYKQVMALSPIEGGAGKQKETVVTLVYSASGGVGKTTIALSISQALAKTFNKVLYINAQLLNSFHHYLSNSATLPNSVVGEFTNTSGNLFSRISHVIRSESFDYLPPFSMALPSIGLNFSVYAEIIKSAKATRKYDVIVVDTDATFDKDKTDLITLADKVMIVVNQNRNSVFATSSLLKNISCNDNEKYYFICNDFKENESNALNSAVNLQHFMINEYVKHFDNFDELTITELGKEADIQKVSFLID